MRRVKSYSVFFALLVIAWNSRAETGVCSGIDVRVEYAVGSDLQAVCSGAEAALRFLARQGFDTDLSLTISVGGPDITWERHRRIFGKYSVPSSDISILSFQDCEALPDDFRLFGQAVTPALHRSFVSHEVAHAVAQHNSITEDLSVAAQEYIAYVVQFSTMPQDLRMRILEHVSNEGFQDISEISAVFWALNPEVFAVKVYRHYQSVQNDQPLFLKKLTERNLIND